MTDMNLGMTDRLKPLHEAVRRMDGVILSWTTDRPGGFTDREIRILRRMQSRFAVAAKLAKREMTARNLAATGHHIAATTLEVGGAAKMNAPVVRALADALSAPRAPHGER